MHSGLLCELSADEECSLDVVEVGVVRGGDEALMAHTAHNQELLVHRLDLLEHPLGLLKWTHVVLVAAHYCKRDVLDVLDRDIGRETMLLI